MELALAGLIVALALWIAAPLFRRSFGSESSYTRPDEATESVLESKHTIYRTILDLELEHRLGKIDEEEYARLLRQSEAEALELIAASESRNNTRTPNEILEEEIREARQRLRSKS